MISSPILRVSYTYDSLARLRKRTLHLNSGASYDTIYECTPGEKSGTTTTLVSTVKNGTEELSYSYDALGNIRSIWENGRKKCTYEYDELSQLVCENNLWEGKRISYSYDKGGNITSRKEYLYTGECLPSVAKQYPYRYCYEYGKERASTSGQGTDSQESLLKEYTYTYGNTNWKDQLTAYEGQPITYDKLGNPLSYRGMTLTWEKGRELTKVVKGGKTITYEYDSEGIRVSKTVDGVKTSYYLNGDKMVSMKTGTGTGAVLTHFVYDQDDNLVLMKHNGKDYYYIHNVQGDVIGLVDSAGVQVVSYRYNSWGKLVAVTDTTAEHIGEKNPFRYRGYYFDVETGWYYLNSRYYDPEVCRFVNADDVEVIKVEDDLSDKNLYSYCDNNPVTRYDESGDVRQLLLSPSRLDSKHYLHQQSMH